VCCLYCKRWFHGDLSAEEAAEIITGTEVGTFLLRLSASQPGSVAVSFVDEKLTPRQTLLVRLKDAKWQSSIHKVILSSVIRLMPVKGSHFCELTGVCTRVYVR
jgi:hypothetical protein